ncbi:MAG: hypothetical protein AB1730_28065 [Myxococcota bacterium]|jgi:hypothetical protein
MPRGGTASTVKVTSAPRRLALAIVSYPSTLEPLFEAITLRLAKHAGAAFVVERCQDPDDVVYLARLWQRRGHAITRLDLYGHGAGGEFSMGDGVLFASDGTGFGRARQLGPLLARGADVRLLGCRTATEAVVPRRDGTRASGTALLRGLEERLRGGRRAWGTTDYLRAEHVAGADLAPSALALLRRATHDSPGASSRRVG